MPHISVILLAVFLHWEMLVVSLLEIVVLGSARLYPFGSLVPDYGTDHLEIMV